MPKQENIRFAKLVDDVYGLFLREYGFTYVKEEKYLVTARKDDIELIFSLETTFLFYNLSLEIKLHGQLGENATSIKRYRHLGILTIAKCLDSNFRGRIKKAQTERELKEILLLDKDVLLNCCVEFLLGNVSSWGEIVDCLEMRRKLSES